MRFEMLSKFVTKLNSDGHIAVGSGVFLIGCAIHIFHGLDASFVAFTTTVLGFVGGHAWVKSQGDSDDSGQPRP